MIEQLTAEKLKKYGFDEAVIARLTKGDMYSDATSISNIGNFFVSGLEQKIYSGDDFFLKKKSYMLFPYDNFDMVPAYFELNQKIFLSIERETAGKLFNEQKAKDRFKQREIENAEIGRSKMFQKHDDKKKDTLYIDWLHFNNKINTSAKDKNTINISEYLTLLNSTHIFEMWENNIKELRIKWDDKKDITGCAIFCNILLTKNMFKNNKPAGAMEFALKKYNLKIETMLYNIRKTENIKKYEKRTIEINRLILDKKFGKI